MKHENMIPDRGNQPADLWLWVEYDDATTTRRCDTNDSGG